MLKLRQRVPGEALSQEVRFKVSLIKLGPDGILTPR
jgi:hypothetical protein